MAPTFETEKSKQHRLEIILNLLNFQTGKKLHGLTDRWTPSIAQSDECYFSFEPTLLTTWRQRISWLVFIRIGLACLRRPDAHFLSLFMMQLRTIDASVCSLLRAHLFYSSFDFHFTQSKNVSGISNAVIDSLVCLSVIAAWRLLYHGHMRAQ